MKLIINADDFGLTKSVNKAIFDLAKAGSLSSTTVMSSLPDAVEANKLLQFKNLSVGLHFNLTQGAPASRPEQIPGLVDRKGNFVEKKELHQRIKNKIITKEEIYTELNAQYEKLRSFVGDNIDHLDSHQGSNKLSIVNEALMQFGKEKKIPAIRVYNKYYLKYINGKYSIEYPHLLSFKEFGIKRVLIEFILKLRTAKIEKYYSHPDGLLLTPSHQAIDVFKILTESNPDDFKNNWILETAFHPAADTKGLENTKLMNERVEEYNFLMSEKFKNAISKYVLVNYKSVLK
jgi:predicted glycoside hydrolase/deacetylase ChbG (UPF0249 family)